MAYSSFFSEERDCSLTPKAEAPPGTRGRFGGIPFKEDPNAPYPARAADQGRRCRQREQERTREKRTVRSRRNCLKKTRRPASGQHGTVCPASIEDHADAAWGRKNETAGILPLSSHRPPKRRRSLRPWVVSS